MCMKPSVARENLESMEVGLLNDGYRFKYFYDRDKRNRPVVTNCKLYKIGEPYSFYGKAKCHKHDDTCKVVGKYLALSRALTAKEREDSIQFTDSYEYKYAMVEWFDNSENYDTIGIIEQE